MRVDYSQLRKFISSTKDQRLLSLGLRRIFSFPENIDTYAYYVFPEAVNTKTPSFHKEVYDFLMSPGDGAIAAPRGHAKSTLAGLIYLSWCVLNYQEKYIVYVSSNHSKTVQFLDPIREAFKHNQRLRFIYGDVMTNVKGDDGRDREDCYDIMGCRVEAVSFEKNLRGFKYQHTRPTLIICDDIESDDRVLNPDLRLKDSYKLDKIIIPSLDPVKGRMKMIGTVLHWDSLLVKKIRLYNGSIYKACDQDFKNILWPDYWTEERLRAKKESIGSVSFSSEFLNNPIENEASLIKHDWIKRCFDENTSYGDVKGGVKYLGVDFAFGDRAVNDSTVFCATNSVNNKHLVFGLDWYKGLSITEQFDMIESSHKNNVYKEVVLEENSIKGMSKELKNYKFPYYLVWTSGSDPASRLKDGPEFDDKRHTIGKKNFILRLATLFENEKIILPYKNDDDKAKSNRLAEELMTFALSDGKLVEVGIHADAPIALGMALERAIEKPEYGWSW